MYLGYIWQAYDSKLEKNVALKIEKKDKSKNILKFEYQVLQHLKGKCAYPARILSAQCFFLMNCD